MPRTPEQIRDAAIHHFNDRAVAKFNAGQEEHGGSLDENTSFVDIEDEIIDLWFYVQSIKFQLSIKMTALQHGGQER